MNEKRIIIVLIISIIVLIVLMIIKETQYTNRIAKVITDITLIQNGLNFNDMEKQEQISKYRKMMIRIFEIYGFKYDNKYKKAMTKDQKVKYIILNYRLASAFNFGLFDVPIIQLLESGFNPYAYNKDNIGERGLGQIYWYTAVLADKIQELLPDNLKKIAKFDLKNKEDLFDPLINTKITYVLLYFLRRDYQGREDWYISVYHWGGFLGLKWFGGRGEFPEKFMINGIKLSPLKYYISFAELKSAFEAGRLSASKEIVEKWENYRKKICKEELDYRRVRRIMINLRKEIKAKDDAKEQLDEYYKNLNMSIKKYQKELRRIGKQSQRDGKTSLRKAKNIVKKLLKLFKEK